MHRDSIVARVAYSKFPPRFISLELVGGHPLTLRAFA